MKLRKPMPLLQLMQSTENTPINSTRGKGPDGYAFCKSGGFNLGLNGISFRIGLYLSSRKDCVRFDAFVGVGTNKVSCWHGLNSHLGDESEDVIVAIL